MNKMRIYAALHLLLASMPGAALAADWGYDDSKQPAELKASPARSLTSPARTSNAPSKSSSSPTKSASPKAGNPFARTPAPKATPSPVEEQQESVEGASAGSPGSLVPMQATPAGSLNAKPTVRSGAAKPPTKAAPKGNAAASAARAKSTASPGKSSGAVEDWIELFELVSKEQITAEQKARYREALAHKMTTPRGSEVSQITAFWPEVRGRIKNSEDEKTAFASLFRALLRFVLKSKNVTEDDSTVLNELLGPERISVPGDPPLTEDSVDAYGDMACFMYEQSHPGKSVDAIDNRTVFASVVARKYSEAPTEKDKRAMSNFSLSWAKFKVVWLAADAADRKQLYEQIAMGKPPEGKDPLIRAIFENGPWHSTQ